MVFYLQADTRYQVKTPSIRKFIEETLENKRHYYALGKIIALRERMKQDQQVIQHIDYGAGSQMKSKEKTVSSFVQRSASNQRKGEILFNIARHMKAETILELGTNLGLGAAYLASSNSKSRVESVEGCPQLSQVARNALPIIGINNVTVTSGKFSEQLDIICAKLEKIDLVFVDGDHSYNGTVEYFNTIKPYLHPQSIVVFDDIYWSDEMMKAWNEIKKHPEVSQSINLFRLGIVFFDKELQNSELKLVPYRYKFWKR